MLMYIIRCICNLFINVSNMPPNTPLAPVPATATPLSEATPATSPE